MTVSRGEIGRILYVHRCFSLILSMMWDLYFKKKKQDTVAYICLSLFCFSLIPQIFLPTAVQYHNLTPRPHGTPQSPHFSQTHCCSSAGETNRERGGGERQRGCRSETFRRSMSSKRGGEIEAAGERDGRGHGEKWGKPINRESLRDQPG